MPVDYRRYPATWKEISLARREKAGWKCEWCGAPNGEFVTRIPGGFWSVEPAWHSMDEVWTTKSGVLIRLDLLLIVTGLRVEYGPEGQLLPICRIWQSKVILTVAHLGTLHPDGRPGDKHDKMDVRPENLAALCQNCHLTYDLPDHIAHARQTRMNRRAVGSLFEAV